MPAPARPAPRRRAAGRARALPFDRCGWSPRRMDRADVPRRPMPPLRSRRALRAAAPAAFAPGVPVSAPRGGAGDSAAWFSGVPAMRPSPLSRPAPAAGPGSGWRGAVASVAGGLGLAAGERGLAGGGVASNAGRGAESTSGDEDLGGAALAGGVIASRGDGGVSNGGVTALGADGGVATGGLAVSGVPTAGATVSGATRGVSTAGATARPDRRGARAGLAGVVTGCVMTAAGNPGAGPERPPPARRCRGSGSPATSARRARTAASSSGERCGVGEEGPRPCPGLADIARNHNLDARTETRLRCAIGRSLRSPSSPSRRRRSRCAPQRGPARLSWPSTPAARTANRRTATRCSG